MYPCMLVYVDALISVHVCVYIYVNFYIDGSKMANCGKCSKKVSADDIFLDYSKCKGSLHSACVKLLRLCTNQYRKTAQLHGHVLTVQMTWHYRPLLFHVNNLKTLGSQCAN